MAFMVPVVTFEAFLEIENTRGETFHVPADVANLSFREPDNTPLDELTDHYSLQEASRYIEGEAKSVKIVRGKYFSRLSAPGYMDATDWSGPFDSEEAAKHAIVEEHEVCAECGADLDDVEGDLCAACDTSDDE